MIYQDNILYVDVEKFQHKLSRTTYTSPKIRLLLGKILPDEFEVTVETIKYLPEDKQTQLRNYIRSIFNI